MVAGFLKKRRLIDYRALPSLRSYPDVTQNRKASHFVLPQMDLFTPMFEHWLKSFFPCGTLASRLGVSSEVFQLHRPTFNTWRVGQGLKTCLTLPRPSRACSMSGLFPGRREASGELEQFDRSEGILPEPKVSISIISSPRWLTLPGHMSGACLNKSVECLSPFLNVGKCLR